MAPDTEHNPAGKENELCVSVVSGAQSPRRPLSQPLCLSFLICKMGPTILRSKAAVRIQRDGEMATSPKSEQRAGPSFSKPHIPHVKLRHTGCGLCGPPTRKAEQRVTFCDPGLGEGAFNLTCSAQAPCHQDILLPSPGLSFPASDFQWVAEL